MRKWLFKEWLQQGIFVGPALFVYLGVTIIPFVLGIMYSFTDWNGISNHIQWVGLRNFSEILFHDPHFVQSFWFTCRYAIVVVIISNVLGFMLAYFLTKPLKAKNWLRTVFFMPHVMGGVLLGFVWQFVFMQGFSAIGEVIPIDFFKYSWLGTPTTSFWALVIVSVWHSAGYLMVIYIAGLTNMPSELLEAAAIDGATAWQTLWRIIVPLVMPSVVICLFLSISWNLKSFDLNISLTHGGPFRSSESAAMDIYFEAFQNNHYGLGAAKSFLFFVVISVVTLTQVILTKKREVEM
ncbi:carbohydrate ABC transporter permease [Paenibacillus rigui]|uniref:ABC transporter permease n=1 Tax=Paenibacillus rigui TaxID=554312 RepID=A0A229UGU0_9BACL|nr:sugar ABC transporter permease [Paenibacillus rigui]OXM82570.1 ABC transporter permease [Paenibacillus rigui]